jgi:hypothetical protein
VLLLLLLLLLLTLLLIVSHILQHIQNLGSKALDAGKTAFNTVAHSEFAQRALDMGKNLGSKALDVGKNLGSKALDVGKSAYNKVADSEFGKRILDPIVGFGQTVAGGYMKMQLKTLSVLAKGKHTSEYLCSD